ncbi:protein ALP1-like [Sitophilus oryzae]|uniref:Protein ALP1-like n=1 Tax=Sitophilus oryzae TaxID=7048 RepID=A0A6J2XE60_SITOR|nr:protein ALP1-like [Sitophilus oryzae]
MGTWRIFAIHAKGGAMQNCWGFIDGTARQICRPSVEEENYYSGHKRFHCLKYQSVLYPDGIIVGLKGAFPGRRHDAGIFRESGLYNQLEHVANFGPDEKFSLYGDQAYGLMDLLITPYQGRPADLQPYQQQFNQSMKRLRVSVE